ncbi:MAG: MFS transporter [Candidatus Eremiobacteraeota bacterium]|nr:MFS transporter [Candidatus Eremiobacteraeota bacterium]
MTLRASRSWLTTSVLAIGVASLLSDACYELIIPLLPAFLLTLGGGAAALGLVEGVADAAAAAFKLWGGQLADHTKHRRAWAAAGYTGVGIFMPAIAFATSVAWVVALRAAAWICRGFRSPIRDTLLVDDTDPAYVNRAFGFQRALETVGACIGPAAAILLVAAHVPLRNAILLGVIPGLLAGAMYIFVRERPRTVPPREGLHIVLAALPADFKQFLLSAGVFGLGNFSATLLVLVAMRALTPLVGAQHAIAYAAALYLGHNILYASLAYPASVLSERFSSSRMLAVSFALFCAVGVMLALGSTSVTVVVLAFICAATGFAINDPMEGTFATALLPAQRRGTGFGALAAVNGVGDFVSSAGVGLLWQSTGPMAAFGAAAIVCGIGLVLLLPLARRYGPVDSAPHSA